MESVQKEFTSDHKDCGNLPVNNELNKGVIF